MTKEFTMMISDKVVGLFKKANIVVHTIPLISVYESLSSLFIEFLKTENIIISKLTPRYHHSGSSHKGWRYDGGNCGRIVSLCREGDAYCYKDNNTLVSFSKYNLPHFLADTVNMSDFTHWLRSKGKEAELEEIIHTLNIVNEEQDKDD